MEKNKRQMWQFPWAYKESFAIVLGIIIIGSILQFFLGSFNFFFLAYPVNLIIGVTLLLTLIGLVFFRKTSFYRWLSGVPLAVTLIGFMLCFTLIMGLTPQVTEIKEGSIDLFSRLGFSQMTTSWSFVLLYLFLLFSLGSLILRKLITFKRTEFAFYFTHIGLWVLLFSAGLGASDIKRYVMHVYEGQVEWRVYDKDKNVLELPIAIQLNDFILEEYPPKLAVIDRETGAIQPEGSPDLFQIDENRMEGSLWKYSIEVKKYIHEAVRNSDSTYAEVFMPGASPAALVRVKMKDSVKSAWVSGGNRAQLYMAMPIDTTYSLVMTQAEPKKFISDIDVFTEDGEVQHTLLEVNKPLRVGHWTIYQYGYDNEAGKMSNYSSFELVYDPWLPWVYVGIFILAVGCIILLWSGNKQKGAFK